MAKLWLKKIALANLFFKPYILSKPSGGRVGGDKITPEPRGGSSRFYRDKTTLQHTPTPPPSGTK